MGDLAIALDCIDRMPGIRGQDPLEAPFVVLSITDSGSGIHPANLEQIFEPFFITKEVGKGTGLGLSQVFGFAKQSGGDVDVETRLGQGTTFRLFLPEVAQGQASEPRNAAPGPVDGTGLRVLVVEDNADVGKFCEQALREYGFAVRLAPSAEHALDTLRTDRCFDVVFSDVVMPGMGGLELAKTLLRSMLHLPVLLASGYSHILAQEGSHGFEVVQKPYSAEQVGVALLRAARS